MPDKSNVPWTKKYAPVKSAEVISQDRAVSALHDFLSKFGRSKYRSALLYGPSGTGKTSLVYALSRELGYEILEINASDVRGTDELQAIVGNASKQASLFDMKKIILVDEVDGISGQDDRGGIPTLAKIINETHFPIIMTASFKEDPKDVHWDSKFTPIKKSAVLIRFERPDFASVALCLKRIAKKERLKIDDDSLNRIANASGNDFRAAITDLETFSQDSKDPKAFLDSLGERSTEETMQSALLKVFKTMSITIASGAFDRVSEDPDSQFLWVDENIAREYTNPEDRARAYDMLSKADVLRGRIRRREYWGFLRTINLMITAGIALSKDKKYDTGVKYREPKQILSIWITNMKYQKRKSIAEKFAKKTHTSTHEATQFIPYLAFIFKQNKKMADSIARELDLEEEEVEWLKK